MELKALTKTQHDILREVHPDVGEIKEHVVEEQVEKIEEIAEQVTDVADALASAIHTFHCHRVVSAPIGCDRSSR